MPPHFPFSIVITNIGGRFGKSFDSDVAISVGGVPFVSISKNTERGGDNDGIRNGAIRNVYDVDWRRTCGVDV